MAVSNDASKASEYLTRFSKEYANLVKYADKIAKGDKDLNGDGKTSGFFENSIFSQLKQFDTNGDFKISDDEITKFYLNQDLRETKSELNKAKEANDEDIKVSAPKEYVG